MKKQWQSIKNRNRKTIKEQKLTCNLPGAHRSPPGRPNTSGPAHLHSSPVVFLPLAPKLLGGERRRRPGHLLLAASPWPLRVTPRSPLAPLSHSLPTPSPFSALPLSRPSALIAAARCCRDHSHCLAMPMRPEAPPRPPRPLHQATRSWTRCNAATVAFSTTGRRGSSPSIRPRQDILEPTNPPNGLAVSPVVFPLSPFARPHAVPAVSPQPELAAAGHAAVAAMACFGRVRARL